jgi:hypothetical protein
VLIFNVRVEDRDGKRLRCSPESTPGSLYNLVALEKGQLDLAIVQADWQKHAFKGTSLFASRGPMTRLRSVMSLYPEPFNLIVRRKAGIESFRDLVGKRVDIGQPASGRQATMRAVMESFGIKLTDFQYVAELLTSDAIYELCAGRVDATVLIMGHPSAVIDRALNECDVGASATWRKHAWQYTIDPAATVSARSLSLAIYKRSQDQTLLHGHRFDPAPTIAGWLSHPHCGQRRTMDTRAQGLLGIRWRRSARAPP